MKKLRDKKILITAGPCWVPLDRVRVITNIFGGSLGVLIAKYALQEGAHVTFLFGPGRARLPSKKENLRIIRFRYFNDLLNLIKKEIKSKRYDIVIHSAAVSDYTPIKFTKRKIKSGLRSLVINLKPTIKIVDLIKKIDPSIFLVKFKLEVHESKNQLIGVAYRSMLQSNADLIVANDFNTVISKHKAYIIDRDKNVKLFLYKENIARGLIKLIIEREYND